MISSSTSKDCHPERSLAVSKANCWTESKDPYHSDIAGASARNFRIAIRFFDDHDTEVLHEPSRKAEACEGSAPFGFAQGRLPCRITRESVNESRRGFTLTTNHP